MDTDTRKASLVGMCAFNNVEQGAQTTLLFTPENERKKNQPGEECLRFFPIFNLIRSKVHLNIF